MFYAKGKKAISSFFSSKGEQNGNLFSSMKNFTQVLEVQAESAESILNKIAKTLNETFRELNSMLLGFRTCFE